MFKKAVKRDAKLRLALCGSAGSGKTFTSLTMASALGGDRVAYVDTEHGSASKYAHTDKCGGPGKCSDTSHFVFDVVEPDSFDPRDLIKFIDGAIDAGYQVICIDSLSHYWMGPNGELDLVDATAKRDTRGNSFAAWKTVTPIHNALVDKILSAPIHIIVSMRTKTEWVVEKDEKTGKSAPRKIGLAPIMRDGIEFEFDVCGDMDQENNLTITKSRCSALAGKVINRPGRKMAEALREWCAGAPIEQPTTQQPAPERSTPEAPAATASAGSGGGAETTAAPEVPVVVQELWNRMGSSSKSIQDVLSELYEQLIELLGQNAADEEYIGIEVKFAGGRGQAVKKVGFARRVVLELWKRIQELKDPKADFLPEGLFGKETAAYAHD